jgi:hypothetical protein
MQPFSHGKPGSMNKVFTPILDKQSRTFLAVNSEPLSLRIWSGTPRCDRVGFPKQVSCSKLVNRSLTNCKAFTGELIYEGQHSDRAAVGGPVGNEVVTSHRIRTGCAEAKARSVISPEPTMLRLLFQDFQTSRSPDAFDSLVINSPAIPSQKGCNSAVSIAAILAG